MAKRKAGENAARAAEFHAQRKAFERQSPARNKDLYDAVAEKANADIDSRFKNLSIDPEALPKVTREHIEQLGSPRAVYDHYGFRGANHPTVALDDPTLPGLGHDELPSPHTLPRPQRWEEMQPGERARIKRAASSYGVTEASAYKSLAAQVDRANVREGGVHHSFYSTEGKTSGGANLPREQLLQSAKSHEVEDAQAGRLSGISGIHFATQAMANALTSPNNRFVQTPKSGPRKGETVYPNDEAADLAIKWAKEGRTGEEYLNHPDYKVPAEDKVMNPRTGKLEKAKGETRGYPVQGYPANQAKAIDAVTKVREGQSIPSAWGISDKEKYSDPKVGPFHNAWVDPHGGTQFWVSDTHSGPAAFAPHLQGQQQELAYMSISGIHAFHDYVARKVMADRGLTSLSGTQSQHWSQEKYEQGHHSDIADMTPADPNKHVHPGDDHPTLF